MFSSLLRSYLLGQAQQKMRAAATQAAEEAMHSASQSELDQTFPVEKPVCHVGLVFALGIEAGGLVDKLAGVIRTDGAGFVAREGGLDGRRIVIVESGVGEAAAAEATRALIQGHEPRWIVSAGFAGGLDDRLQQNDILMADSIAALDGRQLALDLKLPPGALGPRVHAGRLLSVDRVIQQPDEKRRLGQQHGALAVDMETWGVAEACRAGNTRFLSVRVISDTVDRTLPRDIDKLVQQKSNAGRLGRRRGRHLSPACEHQGHVATQGRCSGRFRPVGQVPLPDSAATRLTGLQGRPSAPCNSLGIPSSFPPSAFLLHPSAFLPMVRTRFAPSPTGYLHIGGVRTALFNWLFARRHGGQFLLRIDDTDAQRNVESALAPILHGFRWLGIDWDEGPEVGGPFEPYYQSQRLPQYQAAVDKLLAKGLAYHDYATPEEVQAEREAAQAEKRPFLYSRKFMAETLEQRRQFEDEGRQAVVRLKIPREGTLVIDDLVRGRVEFEWAREQDHVIQRADGTCLYHLASVVDDFDFQITHVIRAEEHLSNTHLGRSSLPSRWATRCRNTRICPTWLSRAARTS